MRTIRSFAIMVIACVLLTGTGWAGIVTQTASVALEATDWGPTALNFAQFDTLGGARTLDSIYIQILGEVSGSTTITNTGSSTGSFTSHLQADVRLSNPGGGGDLLDSIPLILNTDSLAPAAFATHSGDYTDVVDPGNCYPRSNCNTYTSGAVFNAFLGSGTVTLNASAAGTSFGSGSGNFTFSVSSQAAANAEVIYTYTDNGGVPEPGTLSLFGSALIGLGLIGRKQFKH
jgi:hypothetical protein